jgi:hypothetical protein
MMLLRKLGQKTSVRRAKSAAGCGGPISALESGKRNSLDGTQANALLTPRVLCCAKHTTAGRD